MLDKIRLAPFFWLAFWVFLNSCHSQRTQSLEASDLTLAGAKISGTSDLTDVDLLRGLKLRSGEKINQTEAQEACRFLLDLMAFYSASCRPVVNDRQLWIDVAVKNSPGPPLIFDNFVWTTRAALIARLKKDVPLFSPDLPYESKLNSDVTRVLNQVLAEQGIKGSVEHSRFWINRGMNVFVVNGIQVPVVSCEIEGDNAPTSEDIRRWSHRENGWNLSLAGLNWELGFALAEFYYSRGYLHPVVQESFIKFLGERDGKFPVDLKMRISSGPQYTFKSINFNGSAKAHARQLLSEWKLKPGDVYNNSYTSEFESKMLEQPWARKDATSSLTSSSCVTIDESDRTVSLAITVGLPPRVFMSGLNQVCADMHQGFSFPGSYVDSGNGGI